MSISDQGGSEVQSVVLNSGNTSGGNAAVAQVDADEERRIHGFEFSTDGLSSGTDYDGNYQLYVGVDPDVGTGDTSDLGGKLYVDGQFMTDSANGYTVIEKPENDPLVGASWDWNEDVTLTLEAVNSGGTAIAIQVTVYYTEV